MSSGTIVPVRVTVSRVTGAEGRCPGRLQL